MEYDANGFIKKICFRPKCNQSILVREYRKYSLTRPLLCLECWHHVYAFRDILMATKYKDGSMKQDDIEQEVIDDMLRSQQ